MVHKFKLLRTEIYEKDEMQKKENIEGKEVKSVSNSRKMRKDSLLRNPRNLVLGLLKRNRCHIVQKNFSPLSLSSGSLYFARWEHNAKNREKKRMRRKGKHQKLIVKEENTKATCKSRMINLRLAIKEYCACHYYYYYANHTCRLPYCWKINWDVMLFCFFFCLQDQLNEISTMYNIFCKNQKKN